MLKEIKRIEDFKCGVIACLKCGKEIHLWFNNGELDERDCCGLKYGTEYVRIDLVIYEIPSR